MRKTILVALKMASVAGQDKLAGIFRYMSDTYPDESPYDIRLVRTKAEFVPSLAEEAIASGIAGCIVSIPYTDDATRTLLGAGIPAVAIDMNPAPFEGRRDGVAFVRNSGDEIGRAAARYLMGQGVARSYAFLHSNPVLEWGRERFAAFKAALNGHGLWCEELHDAADAAKLKRPAAVLAANDDCAFSLVEKLIAKRARIPQDVAVLGIDNDTLICENSRPRISSVQPDFEMEGFLAAKALDAMLRGRDCGGGTTLVGVKSIVRRESTAELSHSGRLVQRAVSYIDRHALEGIGVRDVVAHLKCSRRLADLRFRQLQGRSILEAITERRLDEVRRRLAETRDKTDAIAEACGFGNANYLKNLFRKRFGMSMSAFRKSAAPT